MPGDGRAPTLVVTGATGGLGSQLVLASADLFREGALSGCIAVCRDPGRLSGRLGELPGIVPVAHDASISGSDYRGLLDVLGKMGSGDVVCVHAAFTMGAIAHVGKIGSKVLDGCVRTNTADFVSLLDSLLAWSEGSGRGVRVVNIDSGAAYRPVDGWALYCSCKAFCNMFLRCCVSEGGVLGVTYEPGVMNTAMQLQIRTSSAKECSESDSFRRLACEGRLRDPADVAADILGRFVLGWEAEGAFEVGYAK